MTCCCGCTTASSADAGLGGLYASGRWHCQGAPILYTACSPALAALEVLVHVDPLLAPPDRRLPAIEVPADLSLESLEPDTLPPGWAEVPAPPVPQALGNAWLRQQRTAALSVPSAVIGAERNIMLHPRHPEASRLRLISDEPFAFDPRLL